MIDDDPGAAFEEGALVSRRFGDVYASRAGALAQARQVFLAGCGVPARWQGRRQFTVGELGFGTGLNMLALLDLWAATRPAGGRLNMFSVEGYCLSHADAARALGAYPELSPLAARLLAQWPQQRRGMVRIDFPALGATLDLALMPAADALAGWQGRADAWFLDGFAPSRNPAMWSAELLTLVGQRTAPGGIAATWSAAGSVRRGLEAAGFAVARMPGFTGKRERIEARMPGKVEPAQLPRVAVVGAGIAGASLARAFVALGIVPTLFAEGPMASANPAGLVKPRLVSGSTAASSLHAQAFGRAVSLIAREAPDAIIATGADWLLRPDEVERARETIASGLFARDSLHLYGDRLHLRDALVVSPVRLRGSWLPDVMPLAVRASRHTADGWWLDDRGPFDAVVLAAGMGTVPLSGLRLRPIRGQVTTAPIAPGHPATSWGAYLVPTDDGLLFGATHGRDDADASIRAEDQAENLAALAARLPDVAARLRDLPLGAVAGVRATTGHHQPIAAELQPGLFALTGLGGRGLALAPLLAEHVAAMVAGAPSPLLAGPRQLLSSGLQPVGQMLHQQAHTQRP